MLDFTEVPDDLEACQQLLRDLMAAHQRLQQVYEELLSTCATVQQSEQKLQQEKEELEQTIKQLMGRLYGRRTERQVPGRHAGGRRCRASAPCRTGCP